MARRSNRGADVWNMPCTNISERCAFTSCSTSSWSIPIPCPRLRICNLVCRTEAHAELVDSFVDATRSRLLHAGASTVDIVQQYIGTIKTLLELDPSGVVLELVSPPVKEYFAYAATADTIKLQARPMMTDDGGDGDGDGEGLYT